MTAGSGGSSGKLSGVVNNKAQRQRLAAIRKQLATIGPSLPGSLVIRTVECGKPYCACHSDPAKLHGPFRSWTRKVAGKTVTCLLAEEQLDDYRQMLDNHRRLRTLVHELEELTLEMIEADPRTPRRRSRRGADPVDKA